MQRSYNFRMFVLFTVHKHYQFKLTCHRLQRVLTEIILNVTYYVLLSYK